MPKVTVYTVCRNYARYLRQAIDSVLAQTMRDWELIVINDGSTDDTADVLKAYDDDRRIRIIHQEQHGLTVSANRALSLARGEYIVRLDADDYFDENALLVLAGTLDARPDIALVFPDYFVVSSEGVLLHHARREKIDEDLSLLDVPAHGAGTMVRRECFLALGGYDDSVDCQDGYDLWLKMVGRYKVHNVNLPLFYYRRHPESLTTNPERILRARRALKERHVRDRYGDRLPEVVALVPVRNSSPFGDGWALAPLGDKPLLYHTLDELQRCMVVSRTVLVTENDAVAEAARARGNEVLMRPAHLARPSSPIEPTVIYALEQLHARGIAPEIVCIVHVNSPFRRAEHVAEAIHTLLLFKPDSVISVCENTRFQYHHRGQGLEPLYRKRELRLEREALYEENGAIYVSWARVVTPESFVGKTVGHIIMTRESSVHLDSRYEQWLAEQLVTVRGSALTQGWDL